MSEMRNFFRRCPNCGRRFEIRLLTKKLIGDKVVTTNFERPSGFMPAVTAGGILGQPHLVEENVPLSIDEQEFQYLYRCKHCGHQWFEVVDNERKLS